MVKYINTKGKGIINYKLFGNIFNELIRCIEENSDNIKYRDNPICRLLDIALDFDIIDYTDHAYIGFNGVGYEDCRLHFGFNYDVDNKPLFNFEIINTENYIYTIRIVFTTYIDDSIHIGCDCGCGGDCISELDYSTLIYDINVDVKNQKISYIYKYNRDIREI